MLSLTQLYKMQLQQYLRNGGSLDDLQNNYHLNIRYHQEYRNLVMFKYAHNCFDFSDRKTQEARGIIFDSTNWDIVSYPYDKFFEIGHKYAPKVDVEHSVIYEKLDGSLMTLYHYDGQWHVASSGVPDASGRVNGKDGMTFNFLFWTTWHELNYMLPDDEDMCYVFELMSPYNRIIVEHKTSNIVLHGARNIHTLQEYDPMWIADIYNWNCVPIHDFNITSLQELITIANDLDPIRSEGFIVCDRDYNRVKIKGKEYLRYAHIGSKLFSNPKKALIMAIQGKCDDIITFYPSYTQEYRQLTRQYNELCDEIQITYDTYKHLPQKEFALQIRDVWYRSCLFDMRKQTVVIREWLNNYDSNKLATILE